jgi:ketosteroid isomerase-like protein
VDEVALVRLVYARWARRESTEDLFDADIEWSMPHPGGQTRGREATMGFLREFIRAWREHVIELEEVRALGDGRVLVLSTERGVGRGSGVALEHNPAAIWTVRNELVLRFQGFSDRAEALQVVRA